MKSFKTLAEKKGQSIRLEVKAKNKKEATEKAIKAGYTLKRPFELGKWTITQNID